MKVLYFVGFHQHFTGSQRSLALMVSRLPASVERVAIFSDDGKAVEGFQSFGIPTRVLPAPEALNANGRQLFRISKAARVRLFFTTLLPYTLRLLRFIRSERPDIVHCNDSRAVLLVGWAARLARKPVVWHLRGSNVLKDQGMLELAVRRLTTAVVTVADAVQADVPKGLPCRTIYNGIDPGACARSPEVERNALELLEARGFDPARTVRLVTASSLVPYKGLHHLVEALHQIVSRRPELADRLVWFALGGANMDEKRKYLQFMQQKAEAYGISRNVCWVGWQDNAYAWAHASDVVILPTIQREELVYPDGERVQADCQEGFPRTLLEAMAAGRPCVATSVAGVREMVRDGETGCVVPPSDPGALAEALERLIDEPELRRKMGLQAREEVARFSLERTVAGTVGLYGDLLASRRQRNGKA